MKIVLDNIEKEIDESFLYVLPTIIIKHIDDYLPKNIVDINNYVNILIEDKYNIKKINFLKLIICALNNLKHTKVKDKFIIYIDHNKFYNNINLYELCKTINYGNLRNSGYPIFTRIFNDVSKNIKSYLREYNYLVGGL